MPPPASVQELCACSEGSCFTLHLPLQKGPRRSAAKAPLRKEDRLWASRGREAPPPPRASAKVGASPSPASRLGTHLGFSRSRPGTEWRPGGAPAAAAACWTGRSASRSSAGPQGAAGGSGAVAARLSAAAPAPTCPMPVAPGPPPHSEARSARKARSRTAAAVPSPASRPPLQPPDGRAARGRPLLEAGGRRGERAPPPGSRRLPRGHVEQAAAAQGSGPGGSRAQKEAVAPEPPRANEGVTAGVLGPAQSREETPRWSAALGGREARGTQSWVAPCAGVPAGATAPLSLQPGGSERASFRRLLRPAAARPHAGGHGRG